MVEEAHTAVTDVLRSHRSQLNSLAHALLLAETLDAAAAYAAAGVKMPPPQSEIEPEPEPKPEADGKPEPEPAGDVGAR